MRLRLQRYDYTITYRQGKELVIADTISRALATNTTAQQQAKQDMRFAEVAHVEIVVENINATEELPISKPQIDHLREETKSDETLQEVAVITK